MAVSTTSLPPFVQALGDGIHAIDTDFHRPRFDAAYLVVEDGRAAFIDTGTTYTVPRLLATLASLGVPLSAVDWVIVTHVHLDHAGGAGALMQELPNARLVVHRRGERHMVNPLALLMSARRVYGAEEMANSYGKVTPVPRERVLLSADGMTIHLAGRPLQLIDTPGHARHHHCIWDEVSAGWFTGDTFGLSYREFDTAQGPWVLPTSTPVQFDPDALRSSIARLMAEQPQWMYLTHYGRVGDVPRLARLMLEHLDAVVPIALALRDAPDRHERLKQGLALHYLRSLRAHGCSLSEARILELLAMDIELNAQGMGIWLDRDDR
jgi:glyoxylase-like metal-dependent hydrolase (beta-lactamase superfamily II)